MCLPVTPAHVIGHVERIRFRAALNPVKIRITYGKKVRPQPAHWILDHIGKTLRDGRAKEVADVRQVHVNGMRRNWKPAENNRTFLPDFSST